MYERRKQAPHQSILESRAIGIVYVATMFTVDSYGDARQPCDYLTVEGAEVPRVHNVWPNSAKEPKQANISDRIVATTLTQRKHPYVLPLDTRLDVAHLRQRNDDMSHRIARQTVNQVDETVLETPVIEAMHDVHHDW